MNKENSFSNLGKWCEQYHEKSKIKVHPSSVPTDLVLEDVLGYIAHLRSNVMMLITALDNMEVRYKHMEQVLDMVELRTQTLCEGGNDLDSRLKELEQLKRTSTKKEK